MPNPTVSSPRTVQLFKLGYDLIRRHDSSGEDALVREEELCVGDLASALGMKPQAVSNQLQRLVDRGILASRREGTSIYYHIVDPCVPVLLERGLCLTECVPENEASATSCCDEAASPCCDGGIATSGKNTKPRKRRAKTATSRRGSH